MQAPPAPYSLQGLVLAALLPQPLRLVALTGALKIGLAGKGGISAERPAASQQKGRQTHRGIGPRDASALRN